MIMTATSIDNDDERGSDNRRGGQQRRQEWREKKDREETVRRRRVGKQCERTLDVVTKNLAVTLGSALSETLVIALVVVLNVVRHLHKSQEQ